MGKVDRELAQEKTLAEADLANVIQYLSHQEVDTREELVRILRERIGLIEAGLCISGFSTENLIRPPVGFEPTSVQPEPRRSQFIPFLGEEHED